MIGVGVENYAVSLPSRYNKGSNYHFYATTTRPNLVKSVRLSSETESFDWFKRNHLPDCKLSNRSILELNNDCTQIEKLCSND